MKRSLLLLIPAMLIITICKAQDTLQNKTYHDKEFNWTITLPSSFQPVPLADWAQLQNRGTKAIEKTYNQKIVNKTKDIFVFRMDRFNYFESLYQFIDPKTDGDYNTMNKTAHEVLYNTLATQIPNSKIDSITVKASIDNLPFDVFILKATIPNTLFNYNMYMFSHMFGKREFSANIMFINTKAGDMMLNAFKSSTFEQ